jgi:Cof subfamily protein (haloacid dehalogenase superfamily)
VDSPSGSDGMADVPLPRMIATDLDGTLLRTDSTLSDRTRDALHGIRKIGVKVVAATARPARVIDELFGVSGLVDMAICGNGSTFYDPDDGVVDIRHPLPTAVLRRVVDRIRDLVPQAGFAVETGFRVMYEKNYLFRPTLDRDRTLVSLDRLLDEPSVKLMVWLPSQDPAVEWARLEPELGELISCTWSSERAPFEIAAPGVSKATGLAALCAEWDIDAAAVIAFGDAVNDLPMMTWAGTSYAVANADPSVRAAATDRTASNDDDGVAQVLERLLP